MSTLLPLLMTAKPPAVALTQLGTSAPGQSNQNMLLMRSTTAGTNNAMLDGWDQSGNMAITGNPTGGYYSPSTNSFSYYFNNSSGITYFNLPTTTYTNLGNSAFTIECFINMDSASSNTVINTYGANNGTGSWGIFTQKNSDGTYSINWSGTSTNSAFTINYTWPAKLTPGVWYHICVQKANTNVLYLNINGTYVGSVTEPTGISSLVYNPTNGGTVTCWIGPGFAGYISNVRVVTTANVYAIGANFSIPTSPLTTTPGVGTTAILTCCSPCLTELMHNLTWSSNGLAAPAVANFGPFMNNKSYAMGVPSVYLDGTSAVNPSTGWDSVQITTSGFAIGVWIYPTQFNSGNTNILAAWGNTTATQGFALGYNVNGTLQLVYTVGTTQTSISGAGTYNLNNWQWNYVLFNRSGSTGSLYVNGKLDKSFTMSGSTVKSGITANVGGPIPSLSWNGTTGYMSELQVSGVSQHTSAFAMSAVSYAATSETGWAWNWVGPNSNSTIDIQTFGGGNIYDAAYQGNMYLTGNTQAVTSPTNFAGYCSVSFDGTGQVAVPTVNNKVTNQGYNATFFTKNAFTVEFWCYPTSFLVNTVHGLFGEKTSQSNYSPIELTVNNGIVTLINATNTTTLNSSVTSTDSLNLNQWNHVAVVRNGGYIGLYMNGKLQGISTCNPYAESANYFYIGGNCSTYSTGYSPFIGYIQEFRIILSPAYTAATYTVPSAVFTTT